MVHRLERIFTRDSQASPTSWTGRSEISQLCKAWRCVYWKMFKVSTDEAIELIQVNTGLCALDTELSRRKSSFVHKMSCSTNSVIYGLSLLRF